MDLGDREGGQGRRGQCSELEGGVGVDFNIEDGAIHQNGVNSAGSELEGGGEMEKIR